MFKDLLQKERVLYKDKVASWEEAITIAAQPLVKQGAIETAYIDAMIESVKEHGPYIVTAPNIAMAHAKAGIGVNENSFSFMKLNKPAEFGTSREHDAQLIFVLASVDSASHIGLLQGFVEALSDDDFVAKLLETQSIDELKELVG